MKNLYLHRWLRTLYALLAVFSIGLPAAASADDDAIQRLQQALQDISEEQARGAATLQRQRSELDRQAADLQPGQVSLAELDAARLDVASRRARLSSLQTRIRSRQDALDEAQDAESAAALKGDEASVATLREEQTLLEAILNELHTLRRQTRSGLIIDQARLAMLQTHFQLPDLDVRDSSSNPLARKRQREIDGLLRDARQARRAGTASEDPAAARWQETQAVVFEEKAEFASIAGRLDQVDRLLGALGAFARSASTPERVLEQGIDHIGQLGDRLSDLALQLVNKTEVLNDQRRVLQQQAELLEPGDPAATAPALYTELIGSTEHLAERVKLAQAQVLERDAQYQAALGKAQHSALLEQRLLPQDTASWSELGKALWQLPGRLAQRLLATLQQIPATFSVADPQHWLALIAGIALLLTSLKAIRLAVEREWLASDGLFVTRIWPFLARHRWLLALIAAVSILAIGLPMGYVESGLLLALFVFLPSVWLLAQLGGGLLTAILEGTDERATRRVVRQLRGLLLVAGTLGTLAFAARLVALSPAMISVLERLALLAPLLAVWPLWRARRLNNDTEHDYRRFGWVLTLLPLLFLIAGALGLLGFTKLGATVLSYTAWALLVGVGYLALVDLIRAGERRVNKRAETRNPESAPFLARNVYGPLGRLSQLAAGAAAVLLITWLWGWSKDTPVVQSLPGFLDMTLFSVGDSPVHMSNVLLTVMVIWAVFWAGGWSRQMSHRYVYRKIADLGIRNSLSTFTQYLVVVFGLMIALRTIGLDLTALTVFAGAMGVGIGFGMQQIVNNFVSGILLLIERPLKVKDVVNVDGKFEGEVMQIGIRSLTVKTWNAEEVIIPNSAVITRPFVNWTRSDDVMRTLLEIQISYDSDPHEARQALLDILKGHPEVLVTPGPAVRLWNFTDSGMLLMAQYFSRVRGDVNRGELRSQINFLIYDRFAELGITIPYPQRDVHVKGAALPTP